MRRRTALTTTGLVLLGLIGVPGAVHRLAQKPVTPSIQRLAFDDAPHRTGGAGAPQPQDAHDA
ncbi:MAG: hypothetical protein EB027_05570, partial [Actinobacteria bacterium]|nr:hypothetical protein [Actinomycetota bacterium]